MSGSFLHTDKNSLTGDVTGIPPSFETEAHGYALKEKWRLPKQRIFLVRQILDFYRNYGLEIKRERSNKGIE